MTISLAVLTVSDSRSSGKRADESGDAIAAYAATLDAEVVTRECVPDEEEVIRERLAELSKKVDLVLTTGGTGVSPRDVTPEATRAVIEKELPGFGEALRMSVFERMPRSILSRATAGVAGRCLIVNLPGSPRGVREALALLAEAIRHGVEVARGDASECARGDESKS